MSKKTEETQPMDPAVREVAAEGQAMSNAPRVCYAAQTLIEEFTELFPETTYETCDVDGRNTALGVKFAIGAIQDEEERSIAKTMIRTLTVSDRVYEAAVYYNVKIGLDHDVATEEGYVRFHSNPRTQDSREPFGLAEAYEILAGV